MKSRFVWLFALFLEIVGGFVTTIFILRWLGVQELQSLDIEFTLGPVIYWLLGISLDILNNKKG
jgi:hypothetical protein